MDNNQQNTNLKKPFIYLPFIYLLITIIIVLFVVFLLAQINPDIYMILLIWVSILFIPVILPLFLKLIFWPKKSKNQVQKITQEQIIYNKNKKLALLIPGIFLGVVSVVMLIYIVLVSFFMPD